MRKTHARLERLDLEQNSMGSMQRIKYLRAEIGCPAWISSIGNGIAESANLCRTSGAFRPTAWETYSSYRRIAMFCLSGRIQSVPTRWRCFPNGAWVTCGLIVGQVFGTTDELFRVDFCKRDACLWLSVKMKYLPMV